MTRTISLLSIALCGSAAFVPAAPKTMVALDCYHNNEATPHYTWQQTALGGYSQFAQVVLGLGADTMSIGAAPDSAALDLADVLIIVDPDNATESPNPHYISSMEADVIDKWVQRGGTLMLLANNAGNCEFTHLNELGAKFGIHFNADTYSGGNNLTTLPDHPFFANCDTLFIKDICTFTLTAPAEAVLTLKGTILLSLSAKGKGVVFSLGDPWVFNEYINSQDNKTSITNVMKWVLSRYTTATNPALPCQNLAHYNLQEHGSRHFLLNGRSLRPGFPVTTLQPAVQLNAPAKSCGTVYLRIK